MGPKPTDQEVVRAWSKLLDDTLRSNNYGDLSADGRFDDWLTRLYINGAADYEDINGEGGDALGSWYALNKRSLLRPEDQDFNKFRSIKQLQRIRNDRSYRNELDRIKDAEHIEKMKRIDKRSEEEIKKVIIWCQQDSFWQNNILSTAKLRQHFDQLNAKRKTPTLIKGSALGTIDKAKYERLANNPPKYDH